MGNRISKSDTAIAVGSVLASVAAVIISYRYLKVANVALAHTLPRNAINNNCVHSTDWVVSCVHRAVMAVMYMCVYLCVCVCVCVLSSAAIPRLASHHRRSLSSRRHCAGRLCASSRTTPAISAHDGLGQVCCRARSTLIYDSTPMLGFGMCGIG